MPKKIKQESIKIKNIEKEKKTEDKAQYYEAVGRRKRSTARVRLYVVTGDTITIKDKIVKNGDFIVNYRAIEQYFPGEIYKKSYLEPFRTTNTLGRFAVSALISGGGLSGQLIAFVHGVSRALVEVDKEKFRPILKKKGFLTRDSRKKQRHMAGFAQKARAKKQS